MRTRADCQGFTRKELLVVIAVLVVLGVMAVPMLAQWKHKASHMFCVSNLKQVGISFRIWADDRHDQYPMLVLAGTNRAPAAANGADTYRYFQVISNELVSPRLLVCPNDTRSSVENFADLKNINVSYFVNLDATEIDPQMPISGDRNITGATPPINGILTFKDGDSVGWTTAIHNRRGNVIMGDGSVQWVEPVLTITGLATNVWRLSLPE